MNITVHYGKDRKQDTILVNGQYRHLDAVASRASMYQSQIIDIWKSGRAFSFIAIGSFVFTLYLDGTASSILSWFALTLMYFVFSEAVRYSVYRRNFALTLFTLPEMYDRRNAWRGELARLKAPDNYISRPLA